MGRSSPQSFEKRQRERRKQRKREEKFEKRLQRASDKRNAKIARDTPMFHTLHRDDAELRVDTDIWLSVLNIAAMHGWKPPFAPDLDDPDAPSFARPENLEVSADDALNLAQSIEAELPSIADEELPLSGQEHGEEHTELLLAFRADGKRVVEDDVLAVREILSGPAKKEAARLASFMKEGAFVIEAS